MENIISKYSQNHNCIYLSTNLFIHPALKDLSFEALMVYGMMLCVQEEEGPGIRITIQDIRQILRCGTTHASTIMHELLDSPSHQR